MKLVGALIENYRSIDRLELDLEFGCSVLIGINESGKSNILRALQLLDPTVSVKPEDLRLERRSEEPVREGRVRFHFRLEAAELVAVTSRVKALFDQESLQKPVAATSQGLVLRLDDFIRKRAAGVYEVSLPDGTRSSNYWALRPDEFITVSGWHKNNTDSPLEMTTADGVAIRVPPRGFFFVAGASDGLQSTTAQIEDIAMAVGKAVAALIPEVLPKCIFWRYSDEYLLPSTVDAAAFAQNPNSCIPLKSMFELAGYSATEIGSSLTNAKAQSQNRYFQLLARVSEAGTKHVRATWKDHKGISIELRPNGTDLVPMIVDDQVPMHMSSRSDGFKRFVSFLLQISAKVRTKELTGVLLLVDEPEIALHPGGARSLARELFDIGESNTVVYSTHSIFMVDRTNIPRHLLVEKKNEVTKARRAEESRIQDEEVLYAAMGYSVFETLRERNVIFEGWRDREVFRVASEAAAKEDKSVKLALEKIGLTFAEGVKDVKNVARFLELAGRGCLIITDADDPALEKRKEYLKPGAWGKWITIAEIVGNASVKTAEDLILRASAIKRANKFRALVPALGALTEAGFQQGEPTLSAMKRWIKDSGVTGKDADEAMANLKQALFANLKRDDLVPEVSSLVEFVLNHDFKNA